MLRIYNELEVIWILEHIYWKFIHVKHMPSICHTTHLGLFRLWKYGNCINCLWQSIILYLSNIESNKVYKEVPSTNCKALSDIDTTGGTGVSK